MAHSPPSEAAGDGPRCHVRDIGIWEAAAERWYLPALDKANAESPIRTAAHHSVTAQVPRHVMPSGRRRRGRVVVADPLEPYSSSMSELSRDEAESFVKAVVQLASMADRVLPPRSSPLTARLVEHLGGVADDVSSTSMSVPVIERVNVQLALDAYAAATDRFDVIGLQSDIGNYGGVSLAGLITGSWHGPGEAARQYGASSTSTVERTNRCRSWWVGVDQSLRVARWGSGRPRRATGSD
jgi:hypothetical protein